MRARVVDVYEEEYVERRKRTIRVEDGVRADVSAWHGGRHLTEVCAFTSVAAAIEEAGEVARKFGVGPGSTLRLRVSEVVTRRWTCPDERTSRAPRPEKVVSCRQVHDAVSGTMEAAPARLGFRMLSWLGLPEGVAPEPYLACHVDVLVNAFSTPLLYEGYGHGELRAGPPRLVPPRASRPRAGRDERLHQVEIAGEIDAWVPPGGDPGRLLAGAMDLRMAYNWEPIAHLEDRRPSFRSAEPDQEFELLA